MPIVLKGKSEDVKVATAVSIYVIPIVWRDKKANLVINLNED